MNKTFTVFFEPGLPHIIFLFLSFPIKAQEISTFNAIADASVWISNTTQNYGATTFQIKNVTSSGITRYGSLSKSITSSDLQ